MATTTVSQPRPPRPQAGEPTWEIAHLFPRQGHWTEAEYLALDTNQLVELSDGYLEVLPMPLPFHQLIVDFLHTLLKQHVAEHSAGRVLFAPLPVRLWPGKFREPDILYLRPERIRNLRRYPEGADLVMEVVSEGQENRERDLVAKPADYAKAGIQEYWIVDPENKSIKILVLDQGGYRVHGEFGLNDTATSVLLPGFEVKVADAFAAGEGAEQA